VQTAIDELDAAQVRTHTRAPDAVPERDAKRRRLMQRLDELRGYVFKIANDNPEHAAEIVESAGMYLKRLRGPAPRVFCVEPTGISGEVRVTAPRAGDRAAYEFQYRCPWLGEPPRGNETAGRLSRSATRSVSILGAASPKYRLTQSPTSTP
jgi:hypothetical protein